MDATDLDEAISIAARIQMAGKGIVEVRGDRDRVPADGLVYRLQCD